MKKFNLKNYITKIYISLIHPSKLKITKIDLWEFFKDFDIDINIIPKDYLLSYLKCEDFYKIISFLFINEIINETKIIKIYKLLIHKLDYFKFTKNNKNFFITKNVNEIIKINIGFLNELIDKIDQQLPELNIKSDYLISLNLYDLIKIFEILFIFPEIIDIKNLLLLFIKSFKKNINYIENLNKTKEIIKFEENNDSVINIDILINFLLLVSKFISFKYGNLYRTLKNDCDNFNYFLWYIYYSIEKKIVN